jgi:WhiB family redox-sensing transcriptional regulator
MTALDLDVIRNIVDLTAQGKSARVIAGQLGIHPRTVTRWRAKGVPGTAKPVAEPTPAVPATAAWQDRAACRGQDPTLFLPADDHPSYARGRAVCVTCPVRAACLHDALTREGQAAAEDRAGLWGGMSPQQRANLAAVRAGYPRPAVSRTDDAPARHRAELLAALRESA